MNRNQFKKMGTAKRFIPASKTARSGIRALWKEVLLLWVWGAGLFPVSLYGQSPGGVSSPELWFQTRPVGSDWNGDYRWVDYSDNSQLLNVYNAQGAGWGEEFRTATFRSYNGYPAINLEKLLDSSTREVLLRRTNLSQATLLGVFAPNAHFDSETLLYGLNGCNGQGVWVSSDRVFQSMQSGKSAFDYGETEGMDLRYSSGDQEASIDNFRAQSIRTVAYYRSTPPEVGVWGEREQAVLTFGSYRDDNVNNSSVFSIPTGSNRFFSGYIPEFIAYNRLLTPIERRQVDSYLAIKYGLSLPVSYLGSSGQLLWDYTAHPAYNHRITALYKDDNSGLDQRESSTSYEEAPHYSYLASSDYYHLGNPNNRTSSAKLLVIGRQYGNSLSDGQYLFWGDNGAPTELTEIEGVLGMKRMERQWILNTNVVNAAESERVLQWEVQDLEFNVDGFSASVGKPAGGSVPQTGYAYTKTPLLGSNGYLGVHYTTLYGKIYLKFGAPGFSTCDGYDYGYYIAEDYRVYPIEKGVVSDSAFSTLVLTTRLELEKQGNTVFLRVNGSRLTESEMTIDPEVEKNAWHASVAFTKGLFATHTILRPGGFTDTGNRVELSCGNATEFSNNDRGSSFLVIDRSGTGNFDEGNVEYIQSDETDFLRRKVIFNHVFFDTDGSGSDAFTFAYRQSDIAGEIEIINPGCNRSNGEVNVNLSSGIPSFLYTLIDESSGDTVQSGRENGYNIHLAGLTGGNYALQIREVGGISITGNNTGGTPTRARTTNFLPVIEGRIEWTVTHTADTYSIGYTTLFRDITSSANTIHYGLKKSGNVVRIIHRGSLQTGGITVREGDVLTIRKVMNRVSYYKNGTEIGSSSISILDYLAKFYGIVDMSEGPAEILSISATGFFDLATYGWNALEGIKVQRSENASLTYRFTLTDPCQLVAAGDLTGVDSTIKGDDLLTVYVPENTRTVMAKVQLAQAQPVSFTAYTLSGQLLAKEERRAPNKIHEAEFTLPVGVYIVKALTATNEYTQKVILN